MPRKTWFWSFSGKWMYILLSSNVKRGANWLNISKYFMDSFAFPQTFCEGYTQPFDNFPIQQLQKHELHHILHIL